MNAPQKPVNPGAAPSLMLAEGGASRAADSPLKLAMLRARLEEAERNDAVAELRSSGHNRLQLLQERLRPVFDEVPPDAEMFDGGLIGADNPRLFVDMVAFVDLARDRRTYRLVQDTRVGRVVLAESDDAGTMVEAVTRYIARRLVERERAQAGEVLVMVQPAEPVRAEPQAAAPAAPPAAHGQDNAPPVHALAQPVVRPVPPVRRRGGFWRGLGLFLLGLLAGGAAVAVLMKNLARWVGA
jgi:hypothetical protein